MPFRRFFSIWMLIMVYKGLTHFSVKLMQHSHKYLEKRYYSSQFLSRYNDIITIYVFWISPCFSLEVCFDCWYSYSLERWNRIGPNWIGLDSGRTWIGLYGSDGEGHLISSHLIFFASHLFSASHLISLMMYIIYLIENVLIFLPVM